MAIDQSTTIQAYQLNKGGTRARLAILRMIAADSVNNFNPNTRLTPGDWRGARNYTMGNYASAYGMFSHCPDGWYSHAGEEFRNEKDSNQYFYTDSHGEESAVGIVVALTHGRFMAGYRWTSNGERAYFKEVFTDEDDAIHMADEHARVFAESARESDDKFQAALDLETRIEESLSRLRECIALRHKACMSYVRDEISDLVESIRASRETLRTDYADYI